MTSKATPPTKTALVTGANRGLGAEVARQLARLGHHVVLAARNPKDAQPVAEEIVAEGGTADVIALDLAHATSIHAASEAVRGKIAHLDVLVNNAGVMPSPRDATDAPRDEIERALAVNTLGPMQLTRELLPLLRKSSGGRVVLVSSGMGAFDEMGGGYLGYRMSKAALNVLGVNLSHALHDDKILVNCVCPGWVNTRMGGQSAPRAVADGASGIVWAATLDDDGPTGGFFRDGVAIGW